MKLFILGQFLLIFICLTVSPSYSLKPEREYKAIPTDYGIIYKEVTITTADGLNLKGWFFPAQDTTGMANNVIGRVLPVPQELKCTPREYTIKYHKRLPTIILLCIPFLHKGV
jgi:hypothetical protein